jgi:hypothetical protein
MASGRGDMRGPERAGGCDQRGRGPVFSALEHAVEVRKGRSGKNAFVGKLPTRLAQVASGRRVGGVSDVKGRQAGKRVALGRACALPPQCRRVRFGEGLDPSDSLGVETAPRRGGRPPGARVGRVCMDSPPEGICPWEQC